MSSISRASIQSRQTLGVPSNLLERRPESPQFESPVPRVPESDRIAREDSPWILKNVLSLGGLLHTPLASKEFANIP